ncbi:hypothetical protein [Anoxybacter fermentans]|nr:hypothetical protein [Anoxybacter fermentans]
MPTVLEMVFITLAVISAMSAGMAVFPSFLDLCLELALVCTQFLSSLG